MIARACVATLCVMSLAFAACSDNSSSASNEQPECVDENGVPFVCLLLDADPVTDGMQSSTTFPVGGPVRIDLWVRNIGEDTPGLGAFTATMPYTPNRLRLSAPGATGDIARLIRQFKWDCLAPAPTAALPADHPFGDGDAATTDAYIGCFQTARSDEHGPKGDVMLASFEIHALAEGETAIGLHGAQASAQAVGAPLLVDCTTADAATNATRCLGVTIDVLPQEE